jgi:hypothetical protein
VEDERGYFPPPTRVKRRLSIIMIRTTMVVTATTARPQHAGCISLSLIPYEISNRRNAGHYFAVGRPFHHFGGRVVIAAFSAALVWHFLWIGSRYAGRPCRIIHTAGHYARHHRSKSLPRGVQSIETMEGNRGSPPIRSHGFTTGPGWSLGLSRALT